MNRTLALSLLPLSLALTMAAAEPPSAGQKAPDFELTALSGSSVRLSNVLGNGPIALVVLRGYPGYQCPYCTRQVQDFVRHADSFAGVRVLLVYPGAAADVPARAQEFAQNKQLPANFDILLDPDYRFTNLYHLRWDAPGETAYPATFVLDPDGVIAYAKVSKSHGGRTSATELAEQLHKSSKK